jgi:hypothetical protein
MSDNYEIEVCYLDKLTRAYQNRTTVPYGDYKEAVGVFNGAVKKMQSEARSTLITMREKKEDLWILLRVEKT